MVQHSKSNAESIAACGKERIEQGVTGACAPQIGILPVTLWYPIT